MRACVRECVSACVCVCVRVCVCVWYMTKTFVIFTCTHAHETKAVYENRYVAQFIERAKHFHKYTRQHLLGIINSDLQPKSQTRMTASVLKQDPNTLKGSEERYSFVLFCFPEL